MELDEINRRVEWSQAVSYSRRIEDHKKMIKRIETKRRIEITIIFLLFAALVVALTYGACKVIF